MHYFGTLRQRDLVRDDRDVEFLGGSWFIATAAFDGKTFAYVGAYQDDAVVSFRVRGDGRLTPLETVRDDDDNYLNGVFDLQANEVGSTWYLVTASYDEDALSVFRIDSDDDGTDGELRHVSSIEADDLGGRFDVLDTPWTLLDVEVGGRQFYVTAAFDGDALGVFELDEEGEIDLTDAVFDDADFYLDAVRHLDAHEIDGRDFVFSGGNEGLAVWELNDRGRLSFIDGVDEYFVDGLAATNWQGRDLLFVTAASFAYVYEIAPDGELDQISRTRLEPSYRDLRELEILQIADVEFLVARGIDGAAVTVLSLDEEDRLQPSVFHQENGWSERGEVEPVRVGSRHFLLASYYRGNGGEVVSLEAGGTGEVVEASSEDDRMVGANGADNLLGLAGDDLMRGMKGRDNVVGGAGDDMVFGGAGGDTLSGGAGDDGLDGGSGGDVMNGGRGFDMLDYSGSPEGVSVDLARNSASGGHAEGDRFSGIEAVKGSAEGDTLIGDGGPNKLIGRGGPDEIDGRGQADVLKGGGGSDTIHGGNGADRIRGGDGADTLRGEGGRDRLRGDGGSDELFGGDGADIVKGGRGGDHLTGGAGRDELTGGGSSDTFKFKGRFGSDVITDFGGGDVIDFSEVGAIDNLGDFRERATTVSGDTIVTFGSGNRSIEILGIREGQFEANDFLFG